MSYAFSNYAHVCAVLCALLRTARAMPMLCLTMPPSFLLCYFYFLYVSPLLLSLLLHACVNNSVSCPTLSPALSVYVFSLLLHAFTHALFFSTSLPSGLDHWKEGREEGGEL